MRDGIRSYNVNNHVLFELCVAWRGAREAIISLRGAGNRGLEMHKGQTEDHVNLALTKREVSVIPFYNVKRNL